MTGILLAERVFTRHPILTGIYDTFRMPRGSSYVLNSSIDMILSKNNRYFYNITGCRHKINVRNPRKNFSFLVYINKKRQTFITFVCRFPMLLLRHLTTCPSAATHHSHPHKMYQYTYLPPCAPGQDRSNTNYLPPDTIPLP